MNKKLLKVAMGAALASGAGLAHANVKVGGHAQVEYYNGEATCAVAGAPRFSGSAICGAGTVLETKGSGLIDNARGRFWISADEDLGGGMKGLVHYEFSVDTANSGVGSAGASPYDTGNRTFDQRAREKFVGISGAFGAIKLGNQHGVYKRMGGVRWDPLNATVLEVRGNGGQSGSADVSGGFAHNGFIQGAIKWESGKLLGNIATVELLYVPHENSTNTAGDGGNGNDYQAGVSVKPIKDLEIIASHSNNKKTPNVAANSDQKANKVGARYTLMKNHRLWLQYEMVDMNSSATASVPTTAGITTTPVDGTYTWLGYHGTFGNHGAVVQYGMHQRDVIAGNTEVEADVISLAYLYNFSKTTKVHVGYRQSTADHSAAGARNSEVSVFAAGLRKDF